MTYLWRERPHVTRTAWFDLGLAIRQRRDKQLLDAIIAVLAEAGSEIRLRDIRLRVEERLGQPVDPDRFKSYVNEQTKLASPRLERPGYGRYQIRRG